MPNLRHGTSVYYGYLRGPVTLTPVVDRLAMELSIPVLTRTLEVRIRTPISRMRDERSSN